MRTIEQVEEMLREAKKRNDALDAIDGTHGFATPGGVPDRELAQTVHAALTTGLMIEDWGSVAEAAVMLEQRWGKQ